MGSHYYSGATQFSLKFMGKLDLTNVAIWTKVTLSAKIELIPSIVLSSDNTDCKNDIQLFPQLFDELSVHTDYH